MLFVILSNSSFFFLQTYDDKMEVDYDDDDDDE